MKRFMVIEADTDFHSLFAYEVTRESDGKGDFWVYRREMACDSTVSEIYRPRFFGQLSALLPSKDTIRDAPAMELVEGDQ